MIAIVSHDAGGAEILSSYVRQQRLDCVYVLDGPARDIFRRKLGAIENCELESAVRASASVLCGTSWRSDIEFNAIKLARALHKPSVAFLDHWINYRERFLRHGETCLPDKILVGDAMAKVMAERTFPSVAIALVENPYLRDVQDEFKAKAPQRRATLDIGILYVCEPVRDQSYTGYSEHDALRYFLSSVHRLEKPVRRIVVRPHPSESIDKYKWALSEFKLPIEAGGERTLLEEIAESDCVVGCGSMAMVVALTVGKPVISCIPPGGRACALPHPQIVRLCDLPTTQASIN